MVRHWGQCAPSKRARGVRLVYSRGDVTAFVKSLIYFGEIVVIAIRGSHRPRIILATHPHHEMRITPETEMNTPQSDHIPTPTRRHFVQRAATGLAALLAGPLHPAGAETMAGQPAVLTGSRFDLAVESRHVDFTGRRVNAVTVNGSSPGPTLKCREGDTVTIALTNHLPVETSIHWHGMRVPSSMDGVPGLSFAGIAPGKTFVYRFPLPQNGTYWYHSHSGFQEQTGLIGALIIEPKDKDPIACDRDYVVLLSDWSDTSAETLFSNLKKQSDYYDFHKRTAGTFIDNVRTQGLRFTVADRLNWGRMNMSPTDIADVTSATYVYLMNGRPANANWTALFTPGERVRLRLINGSAMTFFDVRIPGLPLTVVQADGNYVQPVTVDEIRLGVAGVQVKLCSGSGCGTDRATHPHRYQFTRRRLPIRI